MFYLKTKTTISLKECLEQKAFNWQRLVYETGKPASKPAENVPAAAEQPPLPEVPKQHAPVDFKVDKPDETLKALAENNEALAGNFRKAIIENLRLANYHTTNEDDVALFKKFWQEVGKNGCTKVEIKDKKIIFLNEAGANVAPKQKNVQIKLSADILQALQDRTPDQSKTEVTEQNKRTVLQSFHALPGDKVEVTRYSTPFRGIFNGESFIFEGYERSGTKVAPFLMAGDKIRFIRRTETERSMPIEITVEGRPYLKVGRCPWTPGMNADEQYKLIARDVLVSQNPIYLALELCQEIRKRKVTVDQYAALLKKAHAAVGNGAEVPLVLPDMNVAASRQEREQQERQQAQSTEAGRRVNEGQEFAARWNRTIENIRRQGRQENGPRSTSVADMDKIYRSFYDEYLKTLNPPNPEKQNQLFKKLEAEIKDKSGRRALWGAVFETEGAERKVDSSITLLIENKKNWDKAWQENNIRGVAEIKTIVKTFAPANPDTFGKYADNPDLLRDLIYNVINAGKTNNLYPQDIITAMGITLPGKKTYSQLLTQSLILPSDNPALNNLRQEGLNYTVPLEQLTDAIGAMKAGRAPTLGATPRLHERTEVPKNDLGGKAMQQLLGLLGPDSSTAIGKLQNLEDAKRPYTYSVITLQGRKVGVVIQAPRAEAMREKYKVFLVNPANFKEAYLSYNDYHYFNPDEHVDEIRSRILSLPATRTFEAEKTGGVETTRLPGNVNSYRFTSLNKLQEMSANIIPGQPIREFPLSKSNVFKATADVLKWMGVFDSSASVDTPENRQNIAGNDSMMVNVRYMGKEMTMLVENPTIGVKKIYIAPGFNNYNFDRKNHAEIESASDPTLKNIRALVGRLDVNAIYKMQAGPAEAGIIPQGDLPMRLSEYYFARPKGSITDYNQSILSLDETVQVVFRLYNFEQLKQQGCIKLVEGTTNKYVLVKLPDIFEKPRDQRILNAIYAVKYQLLDRVGDAGMAVREQVTDINAAYERRLRRIFPSAGRFDRSGRTITQTDIRADETKDTQKTDDLFYQQFNGDAAWTIVQPNIYSRNDQNKEVIDPIKANPYLTGLYLKGITFLNKTTLATAKYREMKKTIASRPDLNSRQININNEVTDWDSEVIRLGLIEAQQEKEKVQDKELQKIIDEIAERLGKDERVLKELRKQKPDLTAAELNNSLKMLPVGILLSYQRTPDERNIFGIHAPIMVPLDANNTLVIIPGVTTDGRIGLGFGISNRTKVSDRVAILVSASIGPAYATHDEQSAGEKTVESGPRLGAMMTAGVEIRIDTPDKNTNFAKYLGIGGAAGVDVINGVPGLNAGAYYRWEIDAKQKYQNEFSKACRNDGIEPYINILSAEDYQSNPAKKKALANLLRKDGKMLAKINVAANANDEQITDAFENYAAEFITKFQEDFDLPTVLGGSAKVDVVSGLLIASGPATGGIGYALGFTSLGLQFLGSLSLNLKSRLSQKTSQKTTERALDVVADRRMQEAIAKEYNTMPKDQAPEAAKAERGKGSRLDATGLHYRTDRSEAEVKNIPTNGLDIKAFNEKLKGIGLEIKKEKDGRLYIEVLPTEIKANMRMLVAPDIAVFDESSQRLYLRDPDNLSNLYINRHDRYYPYETSHGASKESLVLISNNRFFSASGEYQIPKGIVLQKLNGEAGYTIETNVDQGKKVLPFTKERIAETGPYTPANIKAANDLMDKALGGPESAEKIRTDIKQLAAKIYQEKGAEFLAITNRDGKEVIGRPAYTKEALFAFYDKYAAEKKLAPLNGAEKEELMIEMSTLRYIELNNAADTPEKKRRVFERELEWARDKVLVPLFKERIKDIKNKKGIEFSQTAEQLAQKAIDDIKDISLSDQISNLEPGTAGGVAIGRYPGGGQGGLNQLLNAFSGTPENNRYGYIIGKDYTTALNTKNPPADYELALLLTEQLAGLPKVSEAMESKDVYEFVNTPYARKISSLHHLIFVLGEENYRKVAEFYQTKAVNAGNKDALKKFMDLVTKIRDAQDNNQDAIAIKGEYMNATYIFTLQRRVQSGVFNRCGNYAMTYVDDITINPPPSGETPAWAAAGSEATTTVAIQNTKEAIGATGGVTATTPLDSIRKAVGAGSAGHTGEGNQGTVVSSDATTDGGA